MVGELAVLPVSLITTASKNPGAEACAMLVGEIVGELTEVIAGEY